MKFVIIFAILSAMATALASGPHAEQEPETAGILALDLHADLRWNRDRIQNYGSGTLRPIDARTSSVVPGSRAGIQQRRSQIINGIRQATETIDALVRGVPNLP
jgi:hypothetical protein